MRRRPRRGRPVAGGLAGLVERGPMSSSTKWKVVPPGRFQASRFSCVTTKTGVWKGASSATLLAEVEHALADDVAPVRSKVSARCRSPPLLAALPSCRFSRKKLLREY